MMKELWALLNTPRSEIIDATANLILAVGAAYFYKIASSRQSSFTGLSILLLSILFLTVMRRRSGGSTKRKGT